jgi:hypothetical protein
MNKILIVLPLIITSQVSMAMNCKIQAGIGKPYVQLENINKYNKFIKVMKATAVNLNSHKGCPLILDLNISYSDKNRYQDGSLVPNKARIYRLQSITEGSNSCFYTAHTGKPMFCETIE